MADSITETVEEPQTSEPAPEPPAPEVEPELGDAGKRALQRLRADNKDQQKRIKDLEAHNAELERANLSHRVAALAAGKLEYPELADKLINVDSSASDDDIAKKIDELLEGMPNLKKREAKPAAFSFNTAGIPGDNQHEVNAQMFASLVHNELNK